MSIIKRFTALALLFLAIASSVKGDVEVTVSVADGYTKESAFSSVVNVLTALGGGSGNLRSNDATAATASALLNELVPGGSTRSAGFSGAYVPSPEYISKLTDFLAQSSTGAALAGHASLNAVGISRDQMCKDIKSGKWSSKVMNCYCTPSESVVHCQALSLLELQKEIAGALPKKPVTVTKALAIVPRNGSCNLYSQFNEKILQSKAGCIGGLTCNTVIANALSIDASINAGCFPAIDIKNAVSGTGKAIFNIFFSGKQVSKENTLQEASKALKGPLRGVVDASLSLKINACIVNDVAKKILDFLNISPCSKASARLFPAFSHAHFDVLVGKNTTQGHAGVRGVLQYVNAKSNPICALGQSDQYWACKSYCNWNAGDGRLKVVTGGNLLGFIKDVQFYLKETPIPPCSIAQTAANLAKSKQ